MTLPAETHRGPRRVAVRLFTISIILVMLLDTLPHNWLWLTPAQNRLTSLLNRVGLWQGEWPLFAPDPIVNNGGLSADLYLADGTQLLWNSRSWARASTWQKFVGFRHVNYYNRVALPRYTPAADDFVDYLVRQTDDPVAQIKLYQNKMTFVPLEGGSLPARDELPWNFSSQLVARRSYAP